MRSGRLDRRIVIQSVTYAADEDGDQVPTWHDLAEVWAEVIRDSARDFLSAMTERIEHRVAFRIRWMEGLTPYDRVLYEGQVYGIEEVRPLGRRAGLELHTTLRT